MAGTGTQTPRPGKARQRERRRLDLALVERGLVTSRERAQALILAGQVRVDERVERRAAQLTDEGTQITLTASRRYVSRGGVKLEHALRSFNLDVTGQVCIDAGASTGGFTDCLLQRGAARVYAVDVGYGQFDWQLRNDPRVILLERTNVRHLELLPELGDFACADVSFISLRLVLPTLMRLIMTTGPIVTLVKPQFEAGRGAVKRGGVVREPPVHRSVLNELTAFSASIDLGLQDLTASPLRGPAGNIEFLALWRRGGPRIDAAELIGSVVDQAHAEPGS